jgi:hypothetical protein
MTEEHDDIAFVVTTKQPRDVGDEEARQLDLFTQPDEHTRAASDAAKHFARRAAVQPHSDTVVSRS